MILPDEVSEVIEKLYRNNKEAYFVGGCVRDSLMGRKPKDYDIACEASPSEIKEIFKDLNVIETGLQHGTVTVVNKGTAVEITEYRGNNNGKNRLCNDLLCRDFTVNALAYGKEGYIDFVNGAEDIKNCIIRSVGDAKERFREDPLRILRMLRFASVLSFAVEPETEQTAFSEKYRLNNVSAERIYSELKKIIMGVNAEYVLFRYREIIKTVIPEIDGAERFSLKDASAVKSAENDECIRLALLLNKCSCPEKVLLNLKADKKTLNCVKILSESKDIILPPDSVYIKRLLYQYGEDMFFKIVGFRHIYDTVCRGKTQLGELYEDIRRKADSIISDCECYEISKLNINGNDLKLAGVKGKYIGKCLETLLFAVIDGKTENKKEKLLEYVRNYGDCCAYLY